MLMRKWWGRLVLVCWFWLVWNWVILRFSCDGWLSVCWVIGYLLMRLGR